MFKKGIVSKQDGKLSVKSKVTFIRCLKIFGKDALSFLNNISTVDLRKLEDGLSQRILFLNKFAKITRDGYVYRLDAENLYLLLFDYKISEFLQYLKSKILVSKVSVEIMEDFVYLLLGKKIKSLRLPEILPFKKIL
jgi:folate-binding Fe-S cluster repair protein YgfZ